MKSSIYGCVVEITLFCVGMEAVKSPAVSEVRVNILECIQQELIKFF